MKTLPVYLDSSDIHYPDSICGEFSLPSSFVDTCAEHGFEIGKIYLNREKAVEDMVRSKGIILESVFSLYPTIETLVRNAEQLSDVVLFETSTVNTICFDLDNYSKLLKSYGLLTRKVYYQEKQSDSRSIASKQGRPPYGWERTKERDENGFYKLKPVASQMNVLDAICDFASSGYNFTQIAFFLNAFNIPSPRNKSWTRGSVQFLHRHYRNITQTQ